MVVFMPNVVGGMNATYGHLSHSQFPSLNIYMTYERLLITSH